LDNGGRLDVDAAADEEEVLWGVCHGCGGTSGAPAVGRCRQCTTVDDTSGESCGVWWCDSCAFWDDGGGSGYGGDNEPVGCPICKGQCECGKCTRVGTRKSKRPRASHPLGESFLTGEVELTNHYY